MNKYVFWLWFTVSVLIATLASIYITKKYKPKPEPIPKECKCTSAKEILLAYEQYQTFIDSVANPRYKKDHPRFQDSINKVNLILRQ